MQINRIRTLTLCSMLCTCLFGQTDTVLFTPVAEFPYPGQYSAYTARFDRSGQPFIYTANKEYGLIIFDFSDLQQLKPVRTFSVQQLHNLKPTDLFQLGNYLYVSLGDFESVFPQSAGLAVLDVSDPANATLRGQWSDAAFNKGSAAVCAAGDYAYLGAMEKGVVILEVSDPDTPRYVSHVVPDLNWPAPPGLFSVPHARGFALHNDDLWTCFDAGGLRLVDVSDKKKPVERARYLNAQLDALAQPAYNTALVAGNYLFAAVDYCGLDVVNIADAANPSTAAWANPWNCSNTSWDGSPGHTNQVAAACHDSLLFLSGGDSEVLAYSIADPPSPRRTGQYAVLHDSIATWGIDVNDSLVVLAQIWNPLNFPYIAKNGGIRLLRWTCPKTTGANPVPAPDKVRLAIFPNPVRDQADVRYWIPEAAAVNWTLHDAWGRPVLRQEYPLAGPGERRFALDMRALPAGVYFLVFQAGEWVGNRIILKQ